nr:hypothetical protein [Providencia rustigianii]
MTISRSAYYTWLKRPAKLITAEQLSLYRKAKAIFGESRNSLGYRTLRKRVMYSIRWIVCNIGSFTGEYSWLKSM